MAITVWKGQLTFGLVSVPVRLVRAARKDRIPLRYVQEVDTSPTKEEFGAPSVPSRAPEASEPVGPADDDRNAPAERFIKSSVVPVRRAYIAADEAEPVASRLLPRGYEVTPSQFAVVHSQELRRLRQPTSPAMEILRSVRMEEIDPVFLETSYYVLPGDGSAHSYGLFYRALKESGYAALAEVGMHGRQHVVVLRPGAKGLIAHTMYYVNEVRGADEYATEIKHVAPKELDLAKRFVEAIAAPFQPEEFTDRYREQLESLIASVASHAGREMPPPAAGKVIDIMDALRESLEKVSAQKSARKPVASAGPSAKPRKRRA
jgi:DNA end-binding protein Ku